MKLNIQRFAVTKTTTFEETNLNPTANTSSLKITIYFSANNSVTYFSGKTLSCTCNGVTKSASVSHSKGGSVTKTFTFDNIQHEADGTKTVSWNWSCSTGTSVLGTVSASGTKTLTSLHKPPRILHYTIEEYNPLLANIGITDDVFVLGLSQKLIFISYELFDNTTLAEASVSDGTNVATINDESDFPIIYDLSQFDMVLENDPNGVLKAGMYVFIQDSMGGGAIFSWNLDNGIAIKDYYDYIPYTKISITESTTTAKRLGQTSGRVGLNINGVFYNGAVGNIDQSTSYKPTIKYKYWKVGDPEPSTYANTIPASDITISDNAFSVNSLDIGSSTETDPNYFNPQFAYRVKVQVNDNFTTTESNELQIQVGEAIWTEYPTHVDFKALTVKGGDVKGKWTYGGKTTGTATANIPDDTTELYFILRVDNNDNVAFPMYIPMLPTTTMRYNNGYAQTSAYTSRITVEITDTTIGLVYANLNNNNVLTNSTMEWWYR